MKKTDFELGSDHGRQGLECRYPNNANYMAGFKRGQAWYLNELIQTAPDDDMKPEGTNDMHADAFHA